MSSLMSLEIMIIQLLSFVRHIPKIHRHKWMRIWFNMEMGSKILLLLFRMQEQFMSMPSRMGASVSKNLKNCLINMEQSSWPPSRLMVIQHILLFNATITRDPFYLVTNLIIWSNILIQFIDIYFETIS